MCWRSKNALFTVEGYGGEHRRDDLVMTLAPSQAASLRSCCGESFGNARPCTIRRTVSAISSDTWSCSAYDRPLRSSYQKLAFEVATILGNYSFYFPTDGGPSDQVGSDKGRMRLFFIHYFPLLRMTSMEHGVRSRVYKSQDSL